MTPPEHVDPVRARRAVLARWVKIAQRTGYLLLAVAVVVFIVGYSKGFNQPTVTFIEVCMVIASILLIPSIILSHGIRAAEKDEAERGD